MCHYLSFAAEAEGLNEVKSSGLSGAPLIKRMMILSRKGKKTASLPAVEGNHMELIEEGP